jgi:hypothetical protein
MPQIRRACSRSYFTGVNFESHPHCHKINLDFQVVLAWVLRLDFSSFDQLVWLVRS